LRLGTGTRVIASGCPVRETGNVANHYFKLHYSHTHSEKPLASDHHSPFTTTTTTTNTNTTSRQATFRRFHGPQSCWTTSWTYCQLCLLASATHYCVTGLSRNDLPHDVTSAESLSTFRQRLKTHLFTKSFFWLFPGLDFT